jgi:glycosyltransferase involved in cell wall biosynthesis
MTCLRLRKLLRTAQPDALIVGNSARCQLVAAGAARQRVICLMHEQDTAARRIARLLSYAGPVVATGANAAAAYATRLGRPVAKIDNMLAPSEMDVLIAGRTARSGEGPPVLGVLGRLIPEKGIRELVEELAQCPDAWERLIVGAPRQEGEYADEVERRIDELGLGSRARLEGEVSDVPTFLAGIDILVLPSTGREGQPTVILEALACARPVVVRQPVFSADYEGLPVVPYRGAADLPQALGRARGLPPADSDALRSRFTPQAVLDVLESIAP